MWTLRSLVAAQAIVTALSAPSGAAPRARHVAEPPRKDAVDDGDGASLDVDVPEVAPVRLRAITAAAERDTAWHAGIGVGADIPLDALNVGVVIQAPSGLRLSSSVGFLADVFLGGMDAPEGGPAATALMHAALRDAVVWRTHLGMKPWKTHGFYASAGYSLCSFGVATTTGDAVSALVDRMLPVGLGSMVHMTSTLHALDLEAGWEWPIAQRFKFRTAISAAMIIASSTSLHVDDGPLAILPLPPTDRLIAPVERAGEAAIDALYKGAGPIVMLTVQLQLDLL
jgi:hypothetical protein